MLYGILSLKLLEDVPLRESIIIMNFFFTLGDKKMGVDAEVYSLLISDDTYTGSETVGANARIWLSGSAEETEEFFVGFSVKDPNGEWRDNDGTTGDYVEVDPGNTVPINLEWKVESQAPVGTYDALSSLWTDHPDNNGERLDSEEEEEAFEIIKEDAEEYDLTVEANGSGSIGVNPPGFSTDGTTETYEDGEEVELTANSNSGYEFVEWIGDVPGEESSDDSITVTIERDKDIVAVFEEESAEYDLTVEANGSGSIGVNPPGFSTNGTTETYEDGEEVELTANSNSGYEFVEWIGDVPGGESSDDSITVTIDRDKDIVVVFEEESAEYDLTVEANGNGIVEVNPPGLSTGETTQSYDHGTEVDLTANPDLDYKFVEWSGDVSGEEQTKNVSVDSDMTITAVFREEHGEVTLTLSVEGDGKITISERGETVESGEIIVSEGDEYTLIAEPGDDAEFRLWDGPVDNSDDGTTTVELTESTHVTAEFEDAEANADISIDDVSVDDPLVGDDVNFDVQIVNTGVGAASDATVTVDVAGETFSTTTSVIEPDEETTVTVDGWAATEPGLVDVTVTVSLDEDDKSEDTDTFTADVQEPSTDLEVLVRSARGDEITGATVTIESETEQQTERTNPGSATFRDISPGEYTVTIEDAGLYQTLEEDSFVEAGENTHFALFDPVDPVTGFVMYADGEAGIEDVTVRIPAVDASTTTDEDGWFEISDEIPDGEYEFEISLPDGEVITRDVELDATRVVPIETETSADLDVDGSPEAVEEDNLLVSSLYKYIMSNPEALLPGFKSPWGVYGVFNGFHSAISFYIDTISTLIENVGFSGIVDMIRGLFDWPDISLSMVSELVQMMVQNIRDEQENDNPYDPHEQSRRYTMFKRGWYEGYVFTRAVVEVLIARGAASASRAVASTSTFQRGVDSVHSTIRIMNEASPSGEAVRNTYHRLARRNDGDVSVAFPTAQVIANSVNPVLFDRIMKGYLMMTDRRKGVIQHYESPLGITRNIAGELAEVYHIQRLMQRRDDIIGVVGNVTEAGRDLTLASLPVGKTLLVRKVEVQVNDRESGVQEDNFEFDAAEVTKESSTTGGRFDSNERITLWEVNSGTASMTNKVIDAKEHVERIQSALQATNKEVIVKTSGLTGRHFRSGNVEVKGAGTRDSASYPEQNGHEIDYWDDPEVRDGEFESIGADIQENEGLFGVLNE